MRCDFEAKLGDGTAVIVSVWDHVEEGDKGLTGFSVNPVSPAEGEEWSTTVLLDRINLVRFHAALGAMLEIVQRVSPRDSSHVSS